MARRTIKITLKPQNSENFLELCQTLSEQNATLGAASPLADGSVTDMAAYNDLLTRASQKREEALELYAAAHAAMYESRVLIGTATGQTINTPDTLFYHTARIKKYLLVLNNENPEALSPWGFDVVVREARRPKRKTNG